MTLIIDLTPTEEAALQRKAAQSGRAADALAREAVSEMLRHDDAIPEDDTPAPGESLYDALQGYIGVVDSKGEFNFSEGTSQHFTDILMEKKRQGRF